MEEQVALFLMNFGHNLRYLLIQDIFQLSGETISRYFHTVLHTLAIFSKDMIKPPYLMKYILKYWGISITHDLKTVLLQSMESLYQ